MYLLTLLVFFHLFLVPIVFHPMTVCRHLIHIGHEPFQGKLLPLNSFEFHLFDILQHPISYIHIHSPVKHRNIFRRIFNRFFGSKPDTLSTPYIYPNLFDYTQKYLRNHDRSPFIHSFIFMYISYFLLTYISSLVHVYRLSSIKTEKMSIVDIRSRAERLMQSTYARWITKALAWKLLGVLVSHVFHVMAVRTMMQALFISYGHFHLDSNDIYSQWNFGRNARLLYEQEGWQVSVSGLIPRIIYELGITLIPRLFWWPIRSLLFRSTVQSYLYASSIEFYFLQCFGENFLRIFSVYLQIFARLTTLDIVSHMHEHIDIKRYPFLAIIRHNFQSYTNLILEQHMTNGLSILFREIY